MKIRNFRVKDIPAIVEILKLNNQYSHPEVDGPEAMKRVKECEAAVFLVAEIDRRVVGLCRGVYDGSRALIHQLSVHPNHQRKGVGKALVTEIVERFRERGAHTVSATITKKSLGFWKKGGFRKIGVLLVGNW